MDNRISVIILAYNVEKYINKCLESIADQTYRNFELVIIDDGSADNSLSIIKSFIQSHPDIDTILYTQNKSGPSAARNKGIELSRGGYITFLDSDDFLEPCMFFDLFSIAVQTNADIVVGYHSRNNDFLDLTEADRTIDVQSGSDFLNRCFTNVDGEYTNTTAVWGKLYKKSIWNSIRFPVGRAYEDEAVFHRVMLQAKTVVSTRVPYYHYINREGSIVNSKKNLKYVKDKAIAFEERAKELQLLKHPLASKFAGKKEG